MDKRIYPERRAYDRANIPVGVRIKTDTGYRHFTTKTLSGGGAFLLSSELPSEETLLEMELFVPSVSLPVRVKGEVVWKQRQEPQGFAVRFTEITHGSRQLIKWVVDRILARKDLQDSIERAYQLSKSL